MSIKDLLFIVADVASAEGPAKMAREREVAAETDAIERIRIACSSVSEPIDVREGLMLEAGAWSQDGAPRTSAEVQETDDPEIIISILAECLEARVARLRGEATRSDERAARFRAL